jgi:hypothetical protein
MRFRPFLIGALIPALMGCEEVVPDFVGLNAPEVVLEHQPGPPGARPGSCWGKSIRPAVIETVQQQILVQPAELMADGSVITPAIYRTETQQRIVTPRRETWFETPCPEDLTPEFIASVQRALKVRGAYRGPITGQMDTRTRAGIRRYQSANGLDSGLLSMETGRQLGLISVGRDTP